MREEMNVVFIKEKRIGDFFDFLFHFKARKIKDGYLIIDTLGTGKTCFIAEQDFTNHFIQISAEEFDAYKRLLYEGDSQKINEYWENLKQKYRVKLSTKC